MDYALRRELIEALQSRGRTHLDAERAADIVLQPGLGEWKVWLSGKSVGQDMFRVARARETRSPSTTRRWKDGRGTWLAC